MRGHQRVLLPPLRGFHRWGGERALKGQEFTKTLLRTLLRSNSIPPCCVAANPSSIQRTAKPQRGTSHRLSQRDREQ